MCFGNMSSQFSSIVKDSWTELASIGAPLDGFCQKVRAFFFEILGELDLEERALGDDFFADFLVDGVSEGQDAFYFPEDVFLQFLLVHLKVYLYDLITIISGPKTQLKIYPPSPVFFLL